MKLLTRLLLILTGLLELGVAFLCGYHLYLMVTSVKNFIDFIEQLFNISNLFFTLLCIICAIFGVKDVLRGILKGRSFVVFFTGAIYIAFMVIIIIKSNELGILQNWDIVTMLISTGVLALLSLFVGGLSVKVAISD